MKRMAIVLLAFLVPAVAVAVNFEFEDIDPVKVGPLGQQYQMYCDLINNEATEQDFLVWRGKAWNEVPSGWQMSICIDGNCLFFMTDSTTVSVGPGDTVSVDLWIDAYTTEAGFLTPFTAEPVGIPGEGVTYDIAVITNGVDYLIVDDDGSEDYETYYEGAIPSGSTSGVWPRNSEAPVSADLSIFDGVIWLTGEESPTLDATDRSNLSTFLGNDGKLFLSGQNIAYDLCDMASPNYSAGACSFLENTLYAEYETNNTGVTDVSGVTGDFIGDGLSFSIAGGASNQTSPDGVTAAAGGHACFEYDGTSYAAGVRRGWGDRRLVFLSFGFEGISTSGNRDTVMQKVIDFWNEPCAVGVAEAMADAPALFGLAPNRPNPFNPLTYFSLSMENKGRASLTIYDPAGRLVKRLLDEVVSAGTMDVSWDGTDSRGVDVATGMYFARFVADEKSETRKVNLIR